MKPARSPQTTGLLPRLVEQALDVGQHLGLGDDGADDLDQPLHGRRVEEVHTDDASGAVVGGGDLGDRQRRGVGRQDRLGRDDVVELAEHRLLDLDRLDDRLDHEVGVGEVLHARGEGDPAQQLGLGLLGELAARDGAVGGVLEVLAAAGQRLLGDLDTGDLEAVAGEHLGDAGAHRAEADDADLLELAPSALPGCPWGCWSWGASSHRVNAHAEAGGVWKWSLGLPNLRIGSLVVGFPGCPGNPTTSDPGRMRKVP